MSALVGPNAPGLLLVALLAAVALLGIASTRTAGAATFTYDVAIKATGRLRKQRQNERNEVTRTKGDGAMHREEVPGRQDSRGVVAVARFSRSLSRSSDRSFESNMERDE